MGIGGCGGKVTPEFLGNRDLDFETLRRFTEGSYITPAGMKGIWLESDRGDVETQKFFKDLHIDKNSYPGVFIPHDSIPQGGDVHRILSEDYGFDLKKQGYVRSAQYLKAVFEIFENDEKIRNIAVETLGSPSPIFDSSWRVISQHTTVGGDEGRGPCDCILFIISLGGGTGTGFINPIVQHIRSGGSKEYPVFTLGVLTEEQDGAGGQQAELSKRNLAAVISIYDLITKGDGVDGLIMVDNQILMNKYENDYTAINRFLYRMMRPLVAGRDYPGEAPNAQAMGDNLRIGITQPPILAPCYCSLPRRAGNEIALVEEALSTEGRYLGCEPIMAEKAYVFCRGYLDVKMIKDSIKGHIGSLEYGDIHVWRKLGDDREEEILILLRNPYGTKGAHRMKNTMECRFYGIIKSALDYIDHNRLDLLEQMADSEQDEVERVRLTEVSRRALEDYFYGKDGLRDQLEMAKVRLKDGEKPVFRRPLRIFDEGGRVQTAGQVNSEVFTQEQVRIIRDMIEKELRKSAP